MKDKIFGTLQKLGKTFMLPIALLPVAGLFLGIGSSLTGESFVGTYNLGWLLGSGTILNKILTVLTDCGDVVFKNLALLFAISVAMGLAKKSKEVAALSAGIAYLMMYASITSTVANFRDITALQNIQGLIGNVLGFENTLNTGVFGGIIIGLIVAWLHNKYYKIKLPDSLSFFGGTHFIPIISSVAAIILGAVMAFVWPFVAMGIAATGTFIAKSGFVGEFLYGYIYRALIPFGLHHVFYLPFWQTALGGTETVAGVVVEGAQNIVFAQLKAGVPIDPNAAKYFSFAFPLMMFGLPGAALAMYHTAKEKNKKNVKGLLMSSSLTSIITGITEPIEFSILFASPLLYFGLNCGLTALMVIIVRILGIGVGYTFSAGLIDFVLYGVLPGNNITHWVPLLLIGLVWGVVYYFSFRFLIVKLNLKTPGREDDEEEVKLHTKKDYIAAKESDNIDEVQHSSMNAADENSLEASIVAGLGGEDNIVNLTNCATRLRVEVSNADLVNEPLLKKTGAAGLMKSGKNVQVIYGTKVSTIATDVNEYLEQKTGKSME